MRLIDADRFIEKVNKDREHECYLHSWTADDVLQRLDSYYAPTVDAIPRERIEQMVAEIEHEKSRLYSIAGNQVCSRILDVIHKYTKEQNNE